MSGARPGEGEPIATEPDGRRIVRYDVSCPSDGIEGDWKAMALYAGQSAGLVGGVKPAAEIVADTVAEARRLLARWAGET